MKFDYKSDPSKCLSASIYLPLEGPFIIVNQHEEHKWKDRPWDDALFEASRMGLTSSRLDLKWGSCAFQKGEDGLTDLCAYIFDTSD